MIATFKYRSTDTSYNFEFFFKKMRHEILYKTGFLRNSSSLFQWLLYKKHCLMVKCPIIANHNNTVYFSIHDNTNKS